MGLREIPDLDISSEKYYRGGGKEREQWESLCKRARESCEEHGFFVLSYDQLPAGLREEMFAGMGSLFDLPEPTKMKHKSCRPYSSYSGKSPVVPLLESFGLDNAHHPDSARSFTDLLWANGNPSFCATINSMSSKMVELNLMILRMIMEGFGLAKHHNSLVENSMTVFRLMKYSAPAQSSCDSAVGLVPHTDKNILTIVCQNDVQGLEVLSKDGHWKEVMLPEGSFVAFVGDSLKAWSNGRLHAATHRVVMSGKKDRYSCGLFLTPKEGTTIAVPSELVDSEHPLLYRPFNYTDFMSYFVANMPENALDNYAGV